MGSMEEVWKVEHPMARSQSLRMWSFGSSDEMRGGNQVCGAGLNHQLAAAQEVCVIERSMRQEGAANLINFGGLGLKHHPTDQTNQTNNQLLALVQQQQQHPQLNPCWSVAHEFHPPTTTRSLPAFVDNRATQCVETAPLRKSNHIPTGSSYEAGMDEQTRHYHAFHPPPAHRKVFPASSSFGRVSTPGMLQGFPIVGELLLTDKTRLEVVCYCHELHLSVAAFVQHASGSRSVSPGAAVFLETGENLVQWRKRIFSKAGVKIDDEVGWDWSDEAASEAIKNRLPNCLPLADHNVRLHHAVDVVRPQSNFTGSNKPHHFPNLSTSEYFDFIDRGARTYSAAVERQQLLRTSEHRPEVSSIELRLGQPSQQAHYAGKPFVRPPYPDQVVEYQKNATSETGLHHHELSGYHGLTQTSMHQYGQQQRLEKINLVNINQFGSGGIERTVLCERTKMWTETPSQTFQNEANRALPDTFLPGGLIRAQNPENPLEQMMKQRLSSASIGLSNAGQYLSQEYSWTQRSSFGVMESQKLPLESNLLPSPEQEGDMFHSVPRLGCEAYLPTEYHQPQHKVAVTILDDVRGVGEKHKSACFAHVTEEEGGSTLQKQDLPETTRREERGIDVKLQCMEISEGKAEEHRQAGGVSTVPTCSGLLVSVGENELPVAVQQGRFGPSSESFPLKTPVETSSLVRDASERAQGVRQDSNLENRSTSTDGNTTSRSGVLSDATTKSSENALGAFPDENQVVNEETSTLESESRKLDMVDEGSGILRCSSEERFSAEQARQDSPSCSKKGGSSAEVNDGSVMGERLERTSEAADRNGVQTRRKRAVKLKSVNGTAGDEFYKKTGNRKRSFQRRTSGSNMKKLPSQQDAQLKNKVDGDHGATVRRPPRMGNGKMMSLKSILELSAKQGIGGEGCGTASRNDVGRSCMTSLRKEVRKRKLSELDTETKCPVFVGPLATVIPRGERSPRGKRQVKMKTAGFEVLSNGPVGTKELVQHENIHAPLLSRRKRDPEASGGLTSKKKKKRDQDSPPLSTTYSCIDDLVPGTGKVKWKSLQNDSFDPPLKQELVRKSKAGKPGGCEVQDVCSVCGSASSEFHNQLIHCSCCPVKVHQACYGVPKVPKASWTCRSCKSNSKNIVCVLCGYGGGAMTRAQKAGAAIKDLLAAWNVSRVKSSRGLRRSSRNPTVDEEEERVYNSITTSMEDPSVTQWIHMVCALWMPGTRCLNLDTMGAFDVSGVSAGRRRLTCSICKRPGGACIQCCQTKCAAPFHAWCAHTQRLLEIETVDDSSGHVRFHGKCAAHAAQTVGVEVVNGMKRPSSSAASKCARTEGYSGSKPLECDQPESDRRKKAKR